MPLPVTGSGVTDTNCVHASSSPFDDGGMVWVGFAGSIVTTDMLFVESSFSIMTAFAKQPNLFKISMVIGVVPITSFQAKKGIFGSVGLFSDSTGMVLNPMLSPKGLGAVGT